MNIAFKTKFLRSIKRIKDNKLKEEIATCILAAEACEQIEDLSQIKKLRGFSDYYRIRIKDYRIGLKLENGTLYFADFAHRKDIYKQFP
jgi:mRNA interferase RelE/StbE